MLRRWKDAEHKTLDDIARLVSDCLQFGKPITKQAVSLWITGESKPSGPVLPVLERLTGIATAAWLDDSQRDALLRVSIAHDSEPVHDSDAQQSGASEHVGDCGAHDSEPPVAQKGAA